MSVCTECGGNVDWRKNAAGMWQCFNAGTAVSHWDACSKRRWDQVKATGTRFEHKDASGYAKSVHGTKFDMKSAGVTPGKNYRPVTHRDGCDVPPWEVCQCQPT